MTNKTTNWKKRFREKFCVVSKDSEDVWFKRADGKPVIDPYLVFEVEDFISQALTQEYKKGFNDCLKEQGLIGEEYQGKYL